MNEPRPPVTTPFPTIPAPDQTASVTYDVVTAVADAKDVSALDLDPLADVVDPDALDRFVASVDDSRSSHAGAVEFSYEGYQVSVHASGHVDVTCDD